eukprot:1158629-Pelagomonas_calceolata.AAC.5
MLSPAMSPGLPAGRYPKRQLHNEWRQLAALILGVSELTMCEDIKHPKYFEVSLGSGQQGAPSARGLATLEDQRRSCI